MKSEPGITKRQADDLLSLMGDDEEMKSRMAKVLKSELGSGRAGHTRDVGRLRR